MWFHKAKSEMKMIRQDRWMVCKSMNFYILTEQSESNPERHQRSSQLQMLNSALRCVLDKTPETETKSISRA